MSGRAETHNPPEPGGSAEQIPSRPDPHLRPSDPAGTRPKVHPDELRPSGDLRALPTGEPAGERTERLPEPVAGASAPQVRSAPPPPPHAPRFQFLLGAFGALGAAATGIALSLALAPASKPGPPWSSWKPSGDVDPAVQIAEHVAPQYTRSPGRPLVAVAGGPQAIGGQPVVVALRSSGSTPTPLPEDGVFYQLCGEGADCSIPGKASSRRGLLVRREALELALYTFHYVGGASQVVVTFPPPPPAKPSKRGSASSSEGASAATPEALSAGSAEGVSAAGASHVPTRVLLFRPEDLGAELSRPLADTLSDTTPTVATIARAPEARLVDRLTGRLVYDSTLIPEQQSSAVLLLQQPSIGG